MIRALDFAPALRIARGFALAAACCIGACVAAVAAHYLVRATAYLADTKPGTFLLLTFAVALWTLVRFAFRRRGER